MNIYDQYEYQGRGRWIGPNGQVSKCRKDYQWLHRFSAEEMTKEATEQRIEARSNGDADAFGVGYEETWELAVLKAEGKALDKVAPKV